MLPSKRAEAPHLRLVSPVIDERGEERPRRSAPNRPPIEGGAPPGRGPRSIDDAQLIASLREGDPSAAAPFYDRARPIVDRSICRVLGRRDQDHDDLAQVAMIALVDSIERFRGDCPLDGWIATVTAHTVYKHLRRRKIEARIFAPEQGYEDDLRAAPAPTPDRQRSLRNAIARVRSHLDALEPNKAWTFLLHHVCGYDLREIADITEVSVAAAQQRLSRGRRELLARLREDPELVELLEGTGSEMAR